MKRNDANVYRCPCCLSSLSLISIKEEGDNVINGKLRCDNNHEFAIENSLPDFTWPKELANIDQQTKDLYNKLAEEYDKFASIPFQTFHTSEEEVRKDMTNRLNLQSDNKVLEIGGGDGRGALHIVKRLSKNARLYFQELSPAFLAKAHERLKEHEDIIEYSIANASYLSFPDNYFDAALHFGGINTFSEVERCLKELARVVKPGGKVVVGDEGIGPWLRNTEFGKVMINSNPLIGYEVPFKSLPVEARNVKVEWIMMGAFFLLEFTVGDGEPKANYHIPIPSERGGTHWKRYYGNLEGISDEAKKLAHEARKRSGKGMSEWLEEVVVSAAKKQLEK
ncbi:class I SAM-dependent methyltransferase [Niastella caeni]|uniref:Class I SAM-dependent methyltransferase n=1 Tax=Niastella caeni TaxID=2569763 RepID=A0A4S8I0X3_9BACT|nr:class I SAM-dependent methyltransferase [Niastella caeni]THU41535.1 class I SAM-dependent methyltransferase [Niastella caeni]